MSETFHWLDHLVVLGYLAVSIGLGIYLRGQSTREEFFQASGSMGRMTVGLSVMATLFSANSFMMYPSTSYAVSLTAGAAVIAFWAMAPVVIWVFIPIYSRLKCKTAYEYLEQRFHVSVRCLASGLFILLRIGWMASATYAASVAISSISGLNQIGVIVGLGAVAIFYTMLGGLRAVMWTDVLQFFIFAGTIVFALGLLISQADGGFSGIVETYTKGRDNLIVDWTLDPKLRFATFAMLIGSFLEGLSAFGADQVAVQRYIAAKDEKTSQQGFLINMLGLSFIVPSLLCIGAGLFAYFEHHPEDLVPVFAEKLQELDTNDARQILAPIAGTQVAMSEDPVTPGFEGPELLFTDVAQLRYSGTHAKQLHKDVVKLGLQDQALPTFVRLKFPPGVVGLLVAALMAATMSSIDSGIHSVTTAIVVDFRDRLFPKLRPATDGGEMRVARIILVIVGALAIVLACFVGELGDVFAVAKKTTAAFGGPLLAVFIVGLFMPRATWLGVLLGTFSGAAITVWQMDAHPDWFSLWFWPIGFFSAVGLSMVLSLIPLPKNARPSGQPLTWSKVMRDSESNA
ncbi:MAG: sodium:solute symporter family transporter [Planctomycetales bacterium]|jgi:Na+/proline symporter